LKSDKSGRVLHKINLEEQLLILWIKFQILAKSALLHILILYLKSELLMKSHMNWQILH
jgi:hypothetical protein